MTTKNMPVQPEVIVFKEVLMQYPAQQELMVIFQITNPHRNVKLVLKAIIVEREVSLEQFVLKDIFVVEVVQNLKFVKLGIIVLQKHRKE